MSDQDEKPPMSSDFEWNLARGERTCCGVRHFDVQKAKQIVAAAPRAVQTLELAPNESWIRDWMGTVLTKENADWSKVDPSFPLIVVNLGGEKFPIDGRHRIRKALEEKAACLRYVELTERESRSVLMAKA